MNKKVFKEYLIINKMEEENFNNSKEEIKELYVSMESVIKMNPQLYIMPIELYNNIMKRMGHMEDRIRKQTQSLKNHLKEKQELRRKLKIQNG